MNLKSYFRLLFKLFKQYGEIKQAKAIYSRYNDPFVKMFYLEEFAKGLSCGKQEILDKIMEMRVNLMEYFEEHEEETI